MSGLQISEHKLQDVLDNKDYRWDSDFYTTKIFYNKSLKYRPIGEIITKCQYGISRGMNDEKGVPIYRMNEIHNMLCDNHVDKLIEMTVNEIENYRLKDGDILFNRTNSYQFVGRTGIYYKKGMANKVFASYLVRFNTDNTIILPEYLTAFLNTQYGQLDIKRRSRPSINQTNVNPEEVKEILIPILSMEIQRKIARNIKEADDLIFKSEKLYKMTETLLLREIRLDDFKSIKGNVSIKNISESFLESGRLDAEYYEPRYDYIEEVIMKYPRGYDYIRNKFKANKTKIDKFKTYKYIEIGDIDIGNGSYEYKELDYEDLPTNAKIKTNMGDVLVSTVRPNRGAISIISDKMNNLVCSGAFTVLQEMSDYNKETLFILFRSEPYRELLLKYNSGTSYPVIKDEDVMNIPIPLIDSDLHDSIKKMIDESNAFRKESKLLIQKTKKAVEIAIKYGEKKALEFLKHED